MTSYLSDQDRRRRAHGAMDRLQGCTLAGDVRGFADAFAVNGVVEFPFGPPGRICPRGRDEIREYARELAKSVRFTAITRQTRHETADPDVLIAEWEVEGVVLATGTTCLLKHVSVLKTGGEGVEHFRDYRSRPVLGEATG